MATQRIEDFLDGSGVWYLIISHSPAFTAQQTAHSIHISGRMLAKTVVVKIDGKLAMAVVPAAKKVNLELLRFQIGAREVILASESEIADHFVGRQLGTIPPFGNLFGVETFFDLNLSGLEEFTYPAGTHTEVIEMRTADYKRLVHPTVLRLGMESEPMPHLLSI